MVRIKIYRKPAFSILEDLNMPSGMPLMLWLQTRIPVARITLPKIHSPINFPSGGGIPGVYSVTAVLVSSVLPGFPKLEPLFFSYKVFFSPSLSNGLFITEFCSLAFCSLVFKN